MYKYKLNNSYTVYVNWSYYSECAKICKDAHKKEKRAYSSITKKPAVTAAPLPRGTKVSSKAFGVGTIAGSVAEGFYGVPQDLQEECYKRLPERLKATLRDFQEAVRSGQSIGKE